MLGMLQADEAQVDTKSSKPKKTSSDGMARGNTIFGSLLKVLAFVVLCVGGWNGLRLASEPVTLGLSQSQDWSVAYPVWGITAGISIGLFWMGEVLMLLYHLREFMWRNDRSQED